MSENVRAASFFVSNRFRLLEGTAKFRFWPTKIDAVVTPMTRFSVVRSGPPLLPGEIGALI